MLCTVSLLGIVRATLFKSQALAEIKTLLVTFTLSLSFDTVVAVWFALITLNSPNLEYKLA
jgi:hypothetical protein